MRLKTDGEKMTDRERGGERDREMAREREGGDKNTAREGRD